MKTLLSRSSLMNTKLIWGISNNNVQEIVAFHVAFNTNQKGGKYAEKGGKARRTGDPGPITYITQSKMPTFSFFFWWSQPQ
jgi:hypothetical protein